MSEDEEESGKIEDEFISGHHGKDIHTQMKTWLWISRGRVELENEVMQPSVSDI